MLKEESDPNQGVFRCVHCSSTTEREPRKQPTGPCYHSLAKGTAAMTWTTTATCVCVCVCQCESDTLCDSQTVIKVSRHERCLACETVRT